jgi:2-desacetyl-2-hydroxyethyl bacteriochlorophyllide A dehydrogenase
MGVMQRRTIYFTAPRSVELHEEPLPAPAADEVLVETVCSAISAGTEMLVYRGQFPELVDGIDSISSGLQYPTAYGYACVGRVVSVGREVEGAWQDRLVFSFQPHTSHFSCKIQALIPVPEGLTAETACFLPGMETAVNLVQDSAPMLGERVLVLGQGIVGLLTAALLREFPLELLVTADHFPLRRAASLALRPTAALDSSAADFCEAALSHCQTLAPRRELSSLPGRGGFDLSVEVSGNPAALNDAIALTAFSGRIVIGSWYGRKRAAIDLGGSFHRSRIKMIASQVSTIAPELAARWDKARRFGLAWEALKRIQPGKWITHHFDIGQAASAYRLLDESPERAIQVVFDHA